MRCTRPVRDHPVDAEQAIYGWRRKLLNAAQRRTLFLRSWLIGGLSVAGVLCAACGTQPNREAEEADRNGPQSTGLFFPRGEAFQVADSPIIVIGTSDTLPLDRVNGATFFGDGFAIAVGLSSQVLIFDKAGRLVARRGRRGAGPGEYIFLGGVVRHGNGLLTWDINNGRVTFLDSQGQYLDGIRLQLRSWTQARILGVFGNSMLVDFENSPAFPVEESMGPLEVRVDAGYEVVSLTDGTSMFEVTLPGEEIWALRDGPQHGYLPVIFGRRAVAAVAGNRAYLGTTDSLMFERFDAAGNRDTVWLGDAEPDDVPDRWVQMVRDTIHRRIDRTHDRYAGSPGGQHMIRGVEFNRRLLRDLPARSTLPRFSAIKGAADGRLWIRGYSDPTQERDVWVVLSEDLVPEAWVEMPRGLNVLDVSADRVLVLTRGEYREPIVEVYEIERMR